MDPIGRQQLSPGMFLRPKRMRRAARNALIFYVASKPLRRPINARRAMLRRNYAPPRPLRFLGWLFGTRDPL
jgi:hypothetical protein